MTGLGLPKLDSPQLPPTPLLQNKGNAQTKLLLQISCLLHQSGIMLGFQDTKRSTSTNWNLNLIWKSQPWYYWGVDAKKIYVSIAVSRRSSLIPYA